MTCVYVISLTTRRRRQKFHTADLTYIAFVKFALPIAETRSSRSHFSVVVLFFTLCHTNISPIWDYTQTTIKDILSIRPGTPCLYTANSKKPKSSGIHLVEKCTLICATFIRPPAAGRWPTTEEEKRRRRQDRRTRRDISPVSDKTWQREMDRAAIWIINALYDLEGQFLISI